MLQQAPSFHNHRDLGNRSICLNRYCVACNTVEFTLQLESFTPICEICFRALSSTMELIRSWVSTYFSWSETISCFLILWLHGLIVGCAFLIILILIGAGNSWSFNFKNLIFRPGLLVAGTSPFLEVGLIVIQKISEGNFELLIKLCLSGFDLTWPYASIHEMSWRYRRRFHKFLWLAPFNIRSASSISSLFGRKL